MKMGFSTKICPELSMEDICSLAKTTSCHYIEFQVEQNQFHGFDKTVEDNKVKDKAKDIIGKYAVKPWVIATYIVISNIDDMDLNDSITRIQKWAEMAEIFKAPYLRVFPMHKGSIRPLALAETLRILADAAAEWPVEILIETHGLVAKGKMMREILDLVDSDKVGAIWDIAHTTVWGETVMETYEYLKPYLKHIHIKDFARLQESSDNHNPYSAWKRFVPFGKGNLPLKELVNVLKLNNYSGVLSVEMPPSYADAETCLHDAVKLAQC